MQTSAPQLLATFQVLNSQMWLVHIGQCRFIVCFHCCKKFCWTAQRSSTLNCFPFIQINREPFFLSRLCRFVLGWIILKSSLNSRFWGSRSSWSLVSPRGVAQKTSLFSIKVPFSHLILVPSLQTGPTPCNRRTQTSRKIHFVFFQMRLHSWQKRARLNTSFAKYKQQF